MRCPSWTNQQNKGFSQLLDARVQRRRRRDAGRGWVVDTDLQTETVVNADPFTGLVLHPQESETGAVQII